MRIRIWFCRIQEKLTATRQARTEKRLFRRLMECTQAKSRQDLREEMDYVRALTEKAYYEKKLSFRGYMRMITSLEIAEKSILKGIRRTGLQAAT